MIGDCSVLTPEIHLKWDQIARERGVLDFGAADELVRFADRHAIEVHGHTLLWDQSTPEWARTDIRRSRDWAVVADWFGAVLPRYAGRIRRWDVVNEPIETEQARDGLRRTVFRRAYGEDYVARALDTAHRLAPETALFVNEYGFDYANPVEEARREAMLALLTRLRKSGAPIHGLGVQAHLDLSKGPVATTSLARFLRGVAALDLDIVISELDVKESDRSGPVPGRDAAVAEQVEAYLAVALAEPRVRGVVTWGLSDKHSWLQDDLGSPNRGLPYDAALTRKPMYHALERAFLAQA